MTELYDIIFTTGVLAALHIATKVLIDRGLDDAAAIVLAIPHPTRAETMPRTARLETARAEGIDTSDIPEATEEWFRKATLVKP